MTEIAFAFALLAAAGWILLAEIRTGSERQLLAHLSDWGPVSWQRALRRVGHGRHLLARIACRDWRRLYPARFVAALDLHDCDPVAAICAANAAAAEPELTAGLTRQETAR